MNSINGTILSLPLETNSIGKVSPSGKNNGDFFSMGQKLRNQVQKESLYGSTQIDQGGLSLDRGDFYLEALRKALLGKGKSLQDISLQSDDLPLLQRLLYQCGFSQDTANRFLEELLSNNPSGEINLLQFFNMITEFTAVGKKMQQSVILEPSAIPYIESMLRDLGLTPKQVGYAVSSARVGGGGLDLNEFVRHVKDISNREMSSQNKDTLDQFITAIEKMISRAAESEDLTPENQAKSAHNLADQISKKLEEIGIRISASGRGEKQITANTAQQSQLPTEVKATIDQILEKVVAYEKDNSANPVVSFAKTKLLDMNSKEESGKRGKKVTTKGLLSPLGEEEGIAGKHGQQKTASSVFSKKSGFFFDLHAGRSQSNQSRLISTQTNDGRLQFNREAVEEGSTGKTETTMGEIAQHNLTSTFSESISTGKQPVEHVRDFLPSYLTDQIGKQISKAILRGENVIRFQLKPPELGSLRIEMDLKDNILKLGMITETHSAKELLLVNVHELKDALINQGVKLDRIDVQINQNFDQSLANSKEGQDQNHNLMQLMTEGGTEETISGSWNMTGENRLLDLVV